MSFATDSENDDLGHGYLRRPISVTELLEREGFRPQARSRATRRALSGVAAGAVLALGAVVGSLFLSHPVTTANGDTLASGSQSGGDIVLAESGTPSSQVPSQSLGTATPAAPAQAGPARTAPVQQHANGPSTPRSDGTISGSWSPSSNTVTPNTNSASSHAVTQSPSTSQAAPSTQSAPPSSAPSTASTPSSSSPSTASTPPAASSTNPNSGQQSSNGGLVGAVTGTLGDLTAPVFNWFGG